MRSENDRVQGNWPRIFLGLSILTTMQVMKRLYLESAGYQGNLVFDVPVVATGFTMGLLFWSGLVALVGRSGGARSVSWSKFIELYVATSMIMVLGAIIDIGYHAVVGNPLWLIPGARIQFEWFTKIAQLAVFLGWSTTIIADHLPARAVRGGTT